MGSMRILRDEAAAGQPGPVEGGIGPANTLLRLRQAHRPGSTGAFFIAHQSI